MKRKKVSNNKFDFIFYFMFYIDNHDQEHFFLFSLFQILNYRDKITFTLTYETICEYV